MFDRFLKFILDLIFPIECIWCGVEDVWLCDTCLSEIKLNTIWCCPVCKIKLTGGQVCLSCHSKSFLDGAIVATSYEYELIDKAVHFFKYKGVKNLSQPLSQLLIKSLKKILFWDNDWIVIPVPLHKRKKRLRGFNQSELLATEVANGLDLRLEKDFLYRSRFTKSQMKLNRNDRLNNIVNSFKVKKNVEAKNIEPKVKKVILIDDIMTTGTTVQECAKVLKQAGVVEVWAVVLARG